MMDSETSTCASDVFVVSDVLSDATDQETWSRVRPLWSGYEEHAKTLPSDRPLPTGFQSYPRTLAGEPMPLSREQWTSPEFREVNASHLPEDVVLFVRAEDETPRTYLVEVKSPFHQYYPVPVWAFYTESTVDVDSAPSQIAPPNDYMKVVERTFDVVAAIGTDEETEAEFTKQISDVVLRHGALAVCEIGHRIRNAEVVPEIAEYVLRALGNLDHVETRSARLWVLKRALESPSAAIRDGANVGLAFMDDPKAIPALRRAIEREQLPLMRKLLLKTLNQLENTASASLPA